jgi:hypothetical protein
MNPPEPAKLGIGLPDIPLGFSYYERKADTVNKDLMDEASIESRFPYKTVGGKSITDLINETNAYLDATKNLLNNYPSGLEGSGGNVSPFYFDPQKNTQKLSEAINGAPTYSAISQPLSVGKGEDFERYVQSDDFKTFGYIPSLGAEQEYRYGRAMTWGDTIGKALGGFGEIAVNTFAEGWKGWARMAQALSTWDSTKLMGTPEERYDIAKEQEDIFNKYAIFDTAESKDGYFNRQFFGNMFQQAGFTVGAMAQFALETYLTAGLGNIVGAGLKGLNIARGVKTATTLGEIVNDVNKATEIVTSSARVTNAFNNAARTIVPLYSGFQDLYKLGKAGAGYGQLAMTTLGGVKRALSEFNMARSESIFEAASTFKELRDKLVNEYIEANGKNPDGDDLEKINKKAEDASHDNFWTNVGVISVMNRLQFNNMFKSFSRTRNIFNEAAAPLAEEAFQVTGKVAGKDLTKAYSKSWFFGELGAVRSIAQDFGKTKAGWEATKMLGKGLTRIEGLEGVQELIQDASNKGLSGYYYDLYHGKQGHSGKMQRIIDSIENPITSSEGMRTFLMGALTGALISPGTKIISKVNQSIEESRKKKEDPDYLTRKERAKESIALVNSLYADPTQFKKEWIANVKINNKAAETMDEAAKNHNKYVFYNAKDSAFAKTVSSAIKLNMFETVRDTIKRAGSNMTDEEFKDAYGIDATEKNRGNVKSFMENIANQMDEYYTTYENLKDKYGDKVLPELYKYNTPEEYAQAKISKKALEDAIEILATNVHKAKQAVIRAASLQTEISKNKNIGASSLEVLTKMGSEEALNDHVKNLEAEIKNYESTDTLTPDLKEILKQKKKELALAKKWESSYQDIVDNSDESYSPAAEKRAYESYADLINLYNERSKNKAVVSKEDVDANFINIIDYIRLNKDNKAYVDAVNLLADPYNMNLVINSMISAHKEVSELFKKDHIDEVYKAADVDKEEKKHVVVKEDETFTVVSPTGATVAKGYATEEEAKVVADKLDETAEKPTVTPTEGAPVSTTPKVGDTFTSDSGQNYVIRGFSEKGDIQFENTKNKSKGVWSKEQFNEYIKEGRLKPDVAPVVTDAKADIERRKKLFGWSASYELAKIAKAEGVDLSKMSREEYADYAIKNYLKIDDSQLRANPKHRNATSVQEVLDMVKADRASLSQTAKDAFESFYNAMLSLVNKPQIERYLAKNVRLLSGTKDSNSWLFFSINNGTNDKESVTHKSYFSLKNLNDFSPEMFKDFMIELQKRGYNGGVKIFQDLEVQGPALSDQVVMHGYSEADAKLALQVAKFFYGDKILESSYGKDEIIDGKSKSYSQILSDKIQREIDSKNVDAELTALEGAKPTDAAKTDRIIEAKFAEQETQFYIEVRGEKKDFLLTWSRNSNKPTLWGEKQPDGTYKPTLEYPSEKDVQDLVDKYVPKNLLSLINKWTDASKLPAGEVLDAQDKIAREIETELAALKKEKTPTGKDNHDILELPSKKRKLTPPTLKKGEVLVDSGKDGLFIISSNGEYEVAKSERNEETVALTYSTKEQALAARDAIIAKDTADFKKDRSYYPFAGTEIRAGLILVDNRTGKQFVVDTKGGPFYAKADEEKNNPLIKLLLLRNRVRQYGDAVIVSQKDFSNYTIKEKVEKYDTGEPVDKDVFRLYRTNELSGIYPHRKQGETEAEAQARMDDFLKKTNANDIKANTTIRIKQNTTIASSKEAGGKDKKTNPNLIQYSEKYQIQIVYKGEPIGYLRNYDTLRYITNGGVNVPMSDLTKNQFRSIFDLKGRGIEKQMLDFKNSFENSKKVYVALSSLAKPGQEIEISKEQLDKILSFEIGAGEFDFVPKGTGVSFEDLPNKTINGFYYILDRAKRYGSGYTFSNTENVITNAFGADRRKIEEEVKQVKNERDATQQLGRYVAVIKMDNGRIRFVELNTDVLEEEKFNDFIKQINERAKETKEKNLQETLTDKKEIVYQRKKVDFNEKLNSELAANLFISVPIEKKGMYIDFSVSDTGNLELTFYNMFEGKEIKRRKIRLYGSKLTDPVNIKDIDDLISKINSRIEEHDKAVIDQRDAIGFKLTRENFRQGTPDVSGYDDIKKLKTNLSEKMVKNIPLSVKASFSLPAPDIKTGVQTKGVAPAPAQSMQNNAGVPIDENLRARFLKEMGIGASPSVQEKEETPVEKTKLEETGLSPAQQIRDNIKKLEAEREIEAQKILEEKVKAGMRSGEALRLSNDEAVDLFKDRINAEKAKLNELRNSNRNMAPKVVNKPTFDATSVVNIDQFKKYVGRILGDIVSVEDMDLLATNLKNGNITVGRFLTYLQKLQNGKTQVRGRIEVGENSPFKYHEAFHAVFRLMLTDKEINKFLAYAKLEVKKELAKEGKTLASEIKAMRELHTIYADMTDAELENRYYEEYMADKFDEWKMNQDSKKILPGIRGLFQKIWDFIKGLFGKFTSNELTGLFREIDRGKYKNSNIKDNRFTKPDALSINEPALKAIKIGEDYVDDENGDIIPIDKYLPQQEGDQIASTIASMFHVRALNTETGKYNKKEILNGIIDDFLELYNPRGSRKEFYYDEQTKLMDIDPAQAKAYMNKLDQKFNIFYRKENRETLMEAVDVHLNIMGYQQELEDDEFTTTEEEFGTRVTTDNWKETHSIGGFGSLSKFLRQYIASTSYVIDRDEFGNTEMVNGEPLIQSVNANLVYGGILKAVANITDQKKFINRLLYLRDNNTETGKFLNKFFDEVGLVIDPNTGDFDITNPKQATLFQMVVKGFQQYTVDYIFMNKDIRNKGRVTRLMLANRMGAAKTQFTQWQNAYIHQFETPVLALKSEEERREFAKEKSLSFQELLSAHDPGVYFSDERLDDLSQDLSNRLKEDLGISLSPLYIKFSIAASKQPDLRTENQRRLAESYSEVGPMDLNGLKAIVKSIQALENPFAKNIDSLNDENMPITGEEDGEEEADSLGEGGNISRLNELAKGNAVFDETVSGTSYRNAEGELVYAHQLPTFHLVKINSLNDIDELNKIKLDDFLEQNHLLSSEDFKSLLGNLRVQRIEGMKSSILKENETGELIEDKTIQANQNEGITYGSFSDREFLISLLELYQYNKEHRGENGNRFMTSNHLIRVIEASNTGDTIALPVNKVVTSTTSGKVSLSQEAINIINKEVVREFNRIKKVRAEIKSGIYPDGEIQGYHYAVDGDGRRTDKKKPRGLKFYKMANMLGTELADELEQDSLDDAFDIASKNTKINSRIKEYWEKQIEDFVKLANDLGVVTVSKSEEGNEEEIQNNLVDDFLRIGFTKKENGKDVIDERRNDLLNIKPGNLRHNLGQILINDYINTLSINQILYGDEAKAFKDEIDIIKRARGANGSGPSLYSVVTSPELGITEAFTKSYMLTFTSPKFKANYAGGLKNKADAQSYQTVKSMRYTLHGLGQLTPAIAKILDKLEAGQELTEKEIFGSGGLKDMEAMFNSKKLVYFDGLQYIKTSTVMLTKEFTSMKVNGKWVAIPGSEELHELRERMEKFEKDNNTVVFAGDRESSKGIKRNIFDHSLGFQNAKDENFVKQDTNYWRLQLVNPSNKIQITDPSQAKQIILSEQEDSTPVTFMGRSTKEDGSQLTIGDIKKMYLSDVDQRVTNNYTRSRDEIFNIDSAYSELGKSMDQGKISPQLQKFQKRAVETLRSTGADSQLIDFFSLGEDGKPKYNLNNNITLDKYTQLFLAYFSKGVMSEKTPGHSVALMSNYGKQVVKIFTGRYDEEGNPIGTVVDERVIKQNPNRYIKNAKRWNNSIDRKFEQMKKGDIYVDDLRHNVPEYDKNGKIIGRYTEFIMPAHYAEYFNLKPGEPIPDHIAKMFGVRIPSQAKHSFVALRLVGFMPAYYGSTAIFPHELIEISGADFDIDKLYMHIYDTYVKDGQRFPYGTETSKEGKFEEYVRWNANNNKAFRDVLQELKETNPIYQELSKKYKEYKKLTKDLDEFRIFESVYFSEELGGKITADERQAIIDMGKKWVNEFKDLVKKLDGVEQKLIAQALGSLKLPSNVLDYAKSKKELNNGVLNNRILEQKLLMLTNEHVISGGSRSIAFEVASLTALTNLLDPNVAGNLIDLLSTENENGQKVLPTEIENILTEGGVDVDSIIGKYKAFKNNKEGSRNIGAAVNSMLTYAILNNFKINLRDTFKDAKGKKVKMYKIKINGHTFDSYSHSNSYNAATGKYDGEDRITNIISTLVSAMTDNAKERLAARLGLNMEALGYVSNMVAQGVPLKSSILLMLQPAVREYFELTKIASNNIKTNEESKIYKSQVAKKLFEKYKKLAGDDYVKEDLTDDIMVSNIKNNGSSAIYQASVLEDFIGISNQTKYFSDVAQVLKLVKGLGTSWEDYDGINNKIEKLGLRNQNDDAFEKFIPEGRKTPPPFDLRQVFMGYDESKQSHYISKWIKIADQINDLSKSMFLERTSVFKRIENIVKDNLSVRASLKDKFNVDLKRDLISYLSIKAYRKFLADRGRAGTLSTMTNALIYDEGAIAKGDKFSDIVDVIRTIRQKLPNNYIAKRFLNVISTTIVNAKGEAGLNPKNKDGFNKLESNTWAKLNEYQIEKLRDSFIEIYQSDIDFDGNGRNGRDMANALFNYLLVKDGGQFRSNSFIKFIPNFMFTDLMQSTGIANDVLKLNMVTTKNIDEEYKKVFGLTANDLFNEFMHIYTRHVGNGYYVRSMTLFAEPKFKDVGNKNVDGFEPKSVVIDGDKIKIDIFNGARIKEKQKAFTEEEESEITWMDDADYYTMLAEETEKFSQLDEEGKKEWIKKEEEAAKAKADSFKYSPDEKKRFAKNMDSLRAKGFYTNKKGEVVFPYIIKQSIKPEGKKYFENTFFVLKSVTKAQKQPKGSPKRMIQPGETVASGVKAVYQKIERKGSSKTFKAGEVFDPIPDTAKLPRYRKLTTNPSSYNPYYERAFSDPEKEEMWMINRGFVKPGETSVTQKKEIATAATKNVTGTPKEILAREGITFTFDTASKSFKFVGDVWDAIPDDAKKTVKTPGQLVYMLGYDITSSAPQIKGNETLGETPIVDENLTEEKAKELGVTDTALRNRFLAALGMGDNEKPSQASKNVPAVGSKEEKLGITDMEKRKEFERLMGFGSIKSDDTKLDDDNPLNDRCAQP